MSPKDFAARFRMRNAEGPDGCCSGRCCVYARMANELDAGNRVFVDGHFVCDHWVCNHPAAREPPLPADGIPDGQNWRPYIGPVTNQKKRAGASNVVVSYLADGDTICDLFVPLGPAAPADGAGPFADALRRVAGGLA